MDDDDVRREILGPSPGSLTVDDMLVGRQLLAASVQVGKCVSLPSASFILPVPLQEHSAMSLHNKSMHKQDVRSEVTDMETDEMS